MTKLLSMVALLISLSGCAHESDGATHATTTPSTAPPASPASGDGRETCVRAVTCCLAYVEAMGGPAAGANVDELCQVVRQLAAPCQPGDPLCIDPAEAAGVCEEGFSSWTRDLVETSRPIPAACD